MCAFLFTLCAFAGLSGCEAAHSRGYAYARAHERVRVAHFFHLLREGDVATWVIAARPISGEGGPATLTLAAPLKARWVLRSSRELGAWLPVLFIIIIVTLSHHVVAHGTGRALVVGLEGLV